MSEALEVEAVPQETALAPSNLFGTMDPKIMLGLAAEKAAVLHQVVMDQGLFKQIGPKKHIFVEGWTFLGSMMGVNPVVVWTRPMKDGDDILGWEARVEARTIGGAVVGAAEASCLYAENNWKNRDDYALRSMAQTRATSKALRLPLGFIAVLAGYAATPAEEMPSEAAGDSTTPHAKAAHPPPKQEKPAAPTKDEVLDREALLVKMMKQLGESDESAICRCGGAMVARIDKDGKPYGTCQVAEDEWRNANPEEKAEVRARNRDLHDFKRLRK